MAGGEHLTMSAVAQKEDIYDPETVQAFAERVGDVRRLTALYLLSVADIRGTSPKVWNAWKGKLLEDLYTSTLRMLARGGQVDTESELEERRNEARNLLRLSLVPGRRRRKTVEAAGHGVFSAPRSAGNRLARARAQPFVDTDAPIVKARISTSKEGIKVLVYTPTSPTCLPASAAFLAAPTTALPTPRFTPPATATRWTPFMCLCPNTLTATTAT